MTGAQPRVMLLKVGTGGGKIAWTRAHLKPRLLNQSRIRPRTHSIAGTPTVQNLFFDDFILTVAQLTAPERALMGSPAHANV